MSSVTPLTLPGIVSAIAEHGAEPLRPFLFPSPPPLPLEPRRSDFDLNPEARPVRLQALQPAAVLLPIIKSPEPTVLFTRRTPHLARHAGQVSFPGGRSQNGDVSLVATALRETMEEVGIAEKFISLAGFLDAYETGTGYAILPVVGVLAQGFALSPDAGEVAEIFEAPLSFLIDPANRERHSTEWQGRLRTYYAFNWKGHTIWGATAAILVDFVDRISPKET